MSDQPEIAGREPIAVEVEEGKMYWWCTCGRSSKQPFCDGSHKGTGIEPLLFKSKRSENVMLCGCKGTDDEPFCDGSHNLV